MYCTNCSREIPESAAFCRYCGCPVQRGGVGAQTVKCVGVPALSPALCQMLKKVSAVIMLVLALNAFWNTITFVVRLVQIFLEIFDYGNYYGFSIVNLLLGLPARALAVLGYAGTGVILLTDKYKEYVKYTMLMIGGCYAIFGFTNALSFLLNLRYFNLYYVVSLLLNLGFAAMFVVLSGLIKSESLEKNIKKEGLLIALAGLLVLFVIQGIWGSFGGFWIVLLQLLELGALAIWVLTRDGRN